jgi:hypothetical protein
MSTNSEESKKKSNAKFVRMQGTGAISWIGCHRESIHEYAAELRRRIAAKEQTGTASDYLTAPLIDCETGNSPGYPLINWVNFNPFCPTVALLWYIPVPGTNEGLLKLHVDSPFNAERLAFGLVPEDNELKLLKEACVCLFAANGHESLRLIRSPPTSVLHGQNWPADADPPLFDRELSRLLFKKVAASVWPDNMLATCDFMRRYKDPWVRFLEECNGDLSRAFGRVEGGRGDFDAARFEQWFDLVSDPEHVKAEQSNFGLAWAYAIDSARNHRRRVN